MEAINIILGLNDIHTTSGIDAKRKAIAQFRKSLSNSPLEQRVDAFMEVQQNCIVTNESEWSNGIAYYARGIKDTLGISTLELINARK